MSKILKLFSGVFLFIVTSLSAEPNLGLDPYTLYVTEVDPETHRLVLSNKIVFQIAQQSWADRLPEVGAEIRLLPSYRDVERFTEEEEGEFRLIYFFHPENKRLNVWMPAGSRQNCVSYVTTEPVCLQPAGWFSSAIYKDAIVLSDGSQWMAESEDQNHFVKGDPIVISKINDFQWIIINLNQISWVNGSDGRRYEKTHGVIVRPFIPEGVP